MNRVVSFTAAILLMTAATVRGNVISGQSEAEFIDAETSLTLLNSDVITANASGVAVASGTAPPPYDPAPTTAVGVDIGEGTIPLVGEVLNVSSATVTSDIASNVDGGLGSRFANATHTIDGLDLGIINQSVLPDLIRVTADTISISSEVVGDFGSLVSTGVMTVENLQVFAEGVQVGSTLNGTILPNTSIGLSTSIGGATLTLNEQATFGDGTNLAGLSATAVSLDLADVGVPTVGSLDGNVSIGLAQASLAPAAIPEPSSWLLLTMVGAGFGLRATRRRFQRNADSSASDEGE